MFLIFLFFSDLSLSISNTSFQSEIDPNVSCLFTIPREILNSQTQANIAFTVFRQTRLFPTGRDLADETSNDTNSSIYVGSYIVSASINVVADGSNLGNNPVKFALRLVNGPDDRGNFSTRECVFWDFKGAGEYNVTTIIGKAKPSKMCHKVEFMF